MDTFAEEVWKEITTAPYGSTRMLDDKRWTKVPGFDGKARWFSDGHIITNVAMYDATIHP